MSYQKIIHNLRTSGLRPTAVLVALLFLLATYSMADVVGTSGNISFDIDDDQANEAILDQTGLGIGTLTPTANLHVMGNSIISQSLIIGGSSNPGGSNLHIQGTLSMGVQLVGPGSNTINSSIVLANTSNGNISLTLPSNLPVGSSITLKRISTNNQLTLLDSGANIESAISVTLGQTNLPYLEIFKNNDEWVVLDGNDYSSNVEIASSNLFLWWPLDESSGNVSYDSSSSGRNGNLTNELVFSGNTTSGPMSNALTWTDPDAVSLYDDGNLPTTAYSYALWTQYDLGSEDTLSMDPIIEGSAGFVWASSNAFYHRSAFHKDASGNFVSTQLNSTLSANTWYHIAVTWGGSNLSLYLNGVYESGNSVSDWASGTNLELTNPGLSDNNQVSADDLRFFSRALSAGEVRALHNAGNP